MFFCPINFLVFYFIVLVGLKMQLDQSIYIRPLNLCPKVLEHKNTSHSHSYPEKLRIRVMSKLSNNYSILMRWSLRIIILFTDKSHSYSKFQGTFSPRPQHLHDAYSTRPKFLEYFLRRRCPVRKSVSIHFVVYQKPMHSLKLLKFISPWSYGGKYIFYLSIIW